MPVRRKRSFNRKISAKKTKRKSGKRKRKVSKRKKRSRRRGRKLKVAPSPSITPVIRIRQRIRIRGKSLTPSEKRAQAIIRQRLNRAQSFRNSIKIPRSIIVF